MKITKHRDGDGWRVHLDGRPTPLIVLRGSPPRFREPQEWDLYNEQTDSVVLRSTSAFGCMRALEELVGILTPTESATKAA